MCAVPVGPSPSQTKQNSENEPAPSAGGAASNAERTGLFLTTGLPKAPQRSVAGLAWAPGPFFSLLAASAFASGVAGKVISAMGSQGALVALWDGFGISAFVWCWAWILVSRGCRDELTNRFLDRLDLWAGGLAVLGIVAPFTSASWLALSGLGVYLAIRGVGAERSSGRLMLALTVPVFWGPQILDLMNGPILAFDAQLVAAVLGATPEHNIVPIPGSSEFLWIAPQCSSLANISLAVLCWIGFCHIRQIPPRAIWPWGVAACAAVVAINTARISLIGLFPAKYDLIHGAVGSFIASWCYFVLLILVYSAALRWYAARDSAGAHHRVQYRT